MDYLPLLKEIVTINSYTQNKQGVDAVGEIFRREFQKLGFASKIFQCELIGNHYLFRSEYHPQKKRLLLLGHLDTVFPPGKFEHFKEDEQWVYGPGVCDMKGGNVVALCALAAAQKRVGKVYNIDMLLVSDEETGSDDSKHLSAALAKEYDYCFVYEAAGEQMEIVTARKGVGTFFIDIDGKAAHAGNHYKEGIDANLEAALKLQHLSALTDLGAGTTLNVGKIEGGIGANTISPHAHLTFELRYTHGSERDRVLSAIEEITKTSFVPGTHAVLRGGIQRDVMQPTWQTEQLVEKLRRISGIELKTQARGGVSDANILSSAGIVTIDGFGPFGDGDHTTHERALKSSFTSRIELSKKLFCHFILEGDF